MISNINTHPPINVNTVVLSFGSNLGQKKQNILSAYDLLERRLGRKIKNSDFFETEAWGFVSEESFINTCAVFTTSHNPQECLIIINDIERELGRIRSGQAGYEDRIIDIDILFYNNCIIDDINLKQIIPDYVHPVLNKKISDI